jgi:hypothetical protein
MTIIKKIEKYSQENKLPKPCFLSGEYEMNGSLEDVLKIQGNVNFLSEELGGRDHVNVAHFGLARNNLLWIVVKEHKELQGLRPLLTQGKYEAHKLIADGSIIQATATITKFNQKVGKYSINFHHQETPIFEESGQFILTESIKPILYK